MSRPELSASPAPSTSARLLRWRPLQTDRDIVRLALPALGALAAEPLYVLVDTAIVGPLGVRPLAALALAGATLSAIFGLCNFLAYAITPRVGRLHAVGRDRDAGELARQGAWLAIGLGVLLALVASTLAGPIIALLAGHATVRALAVRYLRIAALGIPCALLALAGQGYLRGVSDLRRPLVVLVACNVANALLEVLFVYGLGWGLEGSAWATVIAQAGMGVAFLVALMRAPAHRRPPSLAAMRPLLRTGGEIFVRTGSLFGAFLLAGAVLARISATSLGAHQIVFQLWMFLALTLDALAVAAQVMVSQALGAHDAESAHGAARRMIACSALIGCAIGALMMSLIGVLPNAFTSDPQVLERVRLIWPIFAVMQPANGIAFALDGILIGAGGTRYLMWAMLGSSLLVFVPLILLAFALGWGILGVWAALAAFILARVLSTATRFRGRRWAVMGAPAPRLPGS
jgi:putative MATE family efflux protein